MGKNGSLTYADSGVNIDTGNQVVSAIKSIIKDTHNDSVLSNIGGFGGLYELQTRDYSRPILVSSTDGVGTKVKLAQELGMNHLIGIDLVAMCVNDVIVQTITQLRNWMWQLLHRFCWVLQMAVRNLVWL